MLRRADVTTKLIACTRLQANGAGMHTEKE
jgi:hypothetical protein